MPLVRYFTLIGSLLLSLLFLADWYMPKLAAEPTHVDVDRSIIRIHSSHKWPDAIVIDTTLPTITPPAVVTADIPKSRPPREAFALLPQASASASTAKAVGAARPAVPPRRKKMAATAARHVASYQATNYPTTNLRMAWPSW